MKKALLIGLLASVSTAQAGSLTAKPSFPSYSKPASTPSYSSAPQPSSSGPTIGKNVPQNNTAHAPASAPSAPTANTAHPTSPAPAATAPAPAAGSGMGGIVGGMAAGALVGAGAAMLLSDSGSSTPSAGATPAGTVANATIMPYSGNVEQDFMSGMLLWQNKNYAELINITNPYLACTNCSDKDKFMMELNRLGKLNVGTK